MKLESLQDLLEEKVNELYSAEKKTMEVLPRFIEACSSDEVRSAFKEHAEQSRNQVSRLEQVFSRMDKEPKEMENPVIDGLIKKGMELLQSEGRPEVKDAALIAAEQGIEHYEIAGYGTARSYARALNMPEVASLLQETLNEEGFVDEKLSKIADKGHSGPAINEQAI